MKRMTSTWGAGLLALTVSALPTFAQLNGNLYTIDNSQPTAGTNYASFLDAVTALTSMGVSGPVLFAVANTGTPYAGFAITAPIAGASATNTITFLGQGLPVINTVAAGFTQTVRLGTAAVGTIGGPTDLIFDGLEITGAPTGAALIATQCDRIVVRNCRVHTSGSGICFNVSRDCLIEDNELYGVANTVGTPGSVTYAGAISVYYTCNAITIQRNRVRDCTGNGIFVGSSGTATAPLNCIVVNNLVWYTPGLGTYPGGIALRRAGSGIISKNSVWMPAGSTLPGLNYTGGLAADPLPLEISNNVIKHDGTGPCVRLEGTTTLLPPVFDYNLYEPGPGGNFGAVAAVNYTTLASWQALAAPNIAGGKEVNSLVAAIGFIAPGDLHITPASPAFNSGSAVAAAGIDIDLQARPIAGIEDRGADGTLATGLFAGFSAPVRSGPASLTVNFVDSSFSSATITSWAWDFNNDGMIDSTLQSPSFTYICPGNYTVSLTVTDGVNPPSNRTLANYISAGNFRFDLATTGGGVGDLLITPVPTTCGLAVGAATGWTLVSLATTLPTGAGPVFGIVPDSTTFIFLFSPPSPGNPISFVVAPPLYPDGGALPLPPGTFAALAGLSMDAVMVFLTPAGGFLYASNVDRVTF